MSFNVDLNQGQIVFRFRSHISRRQTGPAVSPEFLCLAMTFDLQYLTPGFKFNDDVTASNRVNLVDPVDTQLSRSRVALP